VLRVILAPPPCYGLYPGAQRTLAHKVGFWCKAATVRNFCADFVFKCNSEYLCNAGYSAPAQHL
jgi:hypothetical protein